MTRNRAEGDTVSTSRETVIRTAENFGFEILSGTGSPLDKWRDLRIEMTADLVLVVRFDRIERVREAVIEASDGTRRAIRPANVKILCEHMAAVDRGAVAAVRAARDAAIAAEKANRTCQCGNTLIVGRISCGHKECLGLAELPNVPAGDTVFDELDRQYAAADEFASQYPGRVSPAETSDRRDELSASVDGTHYVDTAGEIPLLSHDGLALFGQSVSAMVFTQLHKVDALTSTLLAIFESRTDRDELMTFAHDRGHAFAGSTSTSAARFLALEALMLAAIEEERMPARSIVDPKRERETVWCELSSSQHKGAHFERHDCLHPHLTDSGTRARLNERVNRPETVTRPPIELRDAPEGAVHLIRTRSTNTPAGGDFVATLTRDEASALYGALRELFG